jgi:iron(III) transport system ATP-binding protein
VTVATELGASLRYGVRVEKLAKKHGGFQALDEVSFDVPEGSFCTLLGPSGCGKTTTLRLLAGLDRPDSGQIWIGPQLVSSRHTFVEPERRRVGLVFQSYALWPHMTVGDQVAYPLRARGVRRDSTRDKVRKVLDLVGLSEHFTRYPAELSGGQQQRVALARAIVSEPSLLLLDEPLSNLDAELRQLMRTELIELHRRIKITTIYVTHDQLEAMSLSDIVIVMNSGRIVESGSPRTIYDHPRTAYTASFVGSANLIPGRIVDTDNATATIQLRDGTVITGLSDDNLTAGEEAVLAIKPEDVILRNAANSGANTLTAEVVLQQYLGTHVMLRLRILGTDIRALADKSYLLDAGDRVLVNLPPDRVGIFAHKERSWAKSSRREIEVTPGSGVKG